MEISQSLIRKLLFRGEEKTGNCYRKIYTHYITKQFEEAQSDSMLKGVYFETKCIGGGARGSRCDDLPRKFVSEKQKRIARVKGLPEPLGDKTADHERIDQQIQNFKIQCARKGINIIPGVNTQVRILKRWEKDKDIMLSMELDVFPTVIKYRGQLFPCILDLKLTQNIDNTFGEYCFGSPEHLDTIQGKMYHYGVRDIDFDLNPHLKDIVDDSLISMIENNNILFVLWVWGYRSNRELKEQNKFINIIWDAKKRAELHEDIRKTKNILQYAEESGWPADPTSSNCKKCLDMECPLRLEMCEI